MEKTEHLRLYRAARVYMFSTYMFMVLLNLWWPSGDKIDIKFSITVQRNRKATVGILNCKWVNADRFFPHSGLQWKYGATFQHPWRGTRLNIYTYLKLGE